MRTRTVFGAVLASTGLLLAALCVDAAQPSLAAFTGVWQRSMKESPRKPPIPYNTAYQARYARNSQLVAEGKLDLGGLCIPPGAVRMLDTIGQFEFIDGPPGRLTVLGEYDTQVRRIHLKGPAPTEPIVAMNGYSTGHWDGRSLVVVTTAISEFSYLDNNAGPHSPELRLTERFTRLSPTRLRIDSTVDDPGAFTAPWQFSNVYEYMPNAELVDYECNENPRNPATADGSLGYSFRSIGE